MADMNQTVRVASGVALALGIWLIVAPMALGYEDRAATWNDILVGVVVAIIAGLTMARPLRYSRFAWINVVLGIWLMVAPFVLRYGDDYILAGVNRPLWNDIMLGILVVVLSWVSATMATRPGSK